MRNQHLLVKLLGLRAKGYNLIPLRGGEIGNPDFKKPMIRWEEYQKRRTTIEELRRWAEQTSTFGIVTGPISNLLVLDLDVKDIYTEELGKAVSTSRGFHKYFKWSRLLEGKVTTSAGIKPHTDVRGEGGYVVLWDSVLPNVASLPEPPQWMLDLLPNKHESPQVVGNAILNLADAEVGNRNNYLFKAAASLRAKGLKAEEIYTVLKPTSDQLNYPDGELRLLCGSAAKYTPNVHVDDSEVFLTSKILSERLKTSWIIAPEVISKQSITFIAGLPEARKTWLLMDLALALATGTKWLGKYDCKQSKVVYLDQERPRASTIERFNKLVAGRGIESKELDEFLLIRPQSRVKLNLPASFESFTRLLDKFKPDLILVDSFKKFHSNNELSSQDMQAVFTKMEEIKDRFGCSFVLLHHEPKGVIEKRKESFEVRSTDASGTIDLQQTAEHFFNVVRHNDESTLYHTKNNLGEKWNPLLIKVTDNTDKTATAIEAF